MRAPFTGLPPGLTFRRTESGCFDLFCFGQPIGAIRRNDGDAFWSNARWTIDGEPAQKRAGGVGGKAIKFAGYHTKEAAFRKAAAMKSGHILAALKH